MMLSGMYTSTWGPYKLHITKNTVAPHKTKASIQEYSTPEHKA